MHDLTGFQRDLLLVIAELDEPNGLAIKERIDEVNNIDINEGRLYPNLDHLADMGLINKKRADGRTNKYILTDRGERDLISHKRRWDEALKDILAAVAR